MSYDLNKPSGSLAIWCLGGSTACIPAYFIFAGNYDTVAAAIFQILGAVFLAIGAFLLFINRRNSETSTSFGSDMLVNGIFILCIITAVVMSILGQTVRFY